MRGVSRYLAFLIALVAVPTWAQTSRGTISGLVLDPQALAVPAATVELTNLNTNIVSKSATNEVGLYRFDAVEPGSYKLNVSHEARDAKVSVAVSSVYSLGGQNAALVFRKV